MKDLVRQKKPNQFDCISSLQLNFIKDVIKLIQRPNASFRTRSPQLLEFLTQFDRIFVILSLKTGDILAFGVKQIRTAT